VAKPEAGSFHAFVRGRVQGVGFRYSAVREARRVGVRGMVRNCEDGSVEVVAEGPEGSLAEFLAWLRRGPPGAHVRDVALTDGQTNGRHYTGFDVEF
jgi:acylphosphatase